MAGGSDKAVYAAITGNSVVMLAKFGGFLVSGSPGMLGEAIHSMADVGNQSLLALGIRKSSQAAEEGFPYGFHRDRYIWALISAVGIFFLGCGVTVYHGVHSFLHPHELDPSTINLVLGVLLFSFVVEGWTLWVAWKAVNEARGDIPMMRYLRTTSDPMASAVLLEDGAAVTGVFMAFCGVVLTHLTGEPRFDAAFTILIGLLLGAIAIALIRRNRALLLGERPQVETVDRIVEILKEQPEVEKLHEVKMVVLGSGALRLAADVDFDGRAIARTVLTDEDLDAIKGAWETPEQMQQWLEEFGEMVVEELGDAVDRIESELIEKVPQLSHVDLEAE